MNSKLPANIAPSTLSLKDFLEGTPPGHTVTVFPIFQNHKQVNIERALDISAIQLHCDSSECDGTRFFEMLSEEKIRADRTAQVFINFWCRNCRKKMKTYALTISPTIGHNSGKVTKLGEMPAFGPHTPSRVISIIGGEREYFLKGRRAENQGLGIAAFAYYRRVVENQKSKIFDEIIKVSKKISSLPEVISDLEAAKKENQFSKAIDIIKHGIPQALLIDGHNPLTLLHSALSEGLHAQSDEECLELATHIRVVLTALVERIDVALKEETALNSAVSRLLKASAQKANRKQLSSDS